MRWVIAHNSLDESLTAHLTLNEKIEAEHQAVSHLLERIKQRYPTISIIQVSVLGSLIEVPLNTNANEFEKEFNCKIY